MKKFISYLFTLLVLCGCAKEGKAFYLQKSEIYAYGEQLSGPSGGATNNYIAYIGDCKDGGKVVLHMGKEKYTGKLIFSSNEDGIPIYDVVWDKTPYVLKDGTVTETKLGYSEKNSELTLLTYAVDYPLDTTVAKLIVYDIYY